MKKLLTSAILASSLLIVGGARAAVTLTHLGSADPTTQGWTKVGSLTGTGVTDSTGDVAAWQINDNSTSAALYYSQNLTTTQVSEAFTEGWSLSVSLRVTGAANTVNTRYIDFVDAQNDKRWGMDFVLVDGNVSVNLRGGDSLTLDDADYHTFSLVYDSSSDTAALWIDGVVTSILGYSGDMSASAITTSQIRWGSTNNGGQGSANYSFVEFSSPASAIPEPSSAALLCGLSGMVFATLHGRRRRR